MRFAFVNLVGSAFKHTRDLLISHLYRSALRNTLRSALMNISRSAFDALCIVVRFWCTVYSGSLIRARCGSLIGFL
ncbi:hypothetical protein HanPI659440_Chr13g0500941 [Helianthus annuus]|nr:hypothetical protein HanPI659440_Chr13g0500941 [Helianthus annuus]